MEDRFRQFILKTAQNKLKKGEFFDKSADTIYNTLNAELKSLERLVEKNVWFCYKCIQPFEGCYCYKTIN